MAGSCGFLDQPLPIWDIAHSFNVWSHRAHVMLALYAMWFVNTTGNVCCSYSSVTLRAIVTFRSWEEMRKPTFNKL